MCAPPQFIIYAKLVTCYETSNNYFIQYTYKPFFSYSDRDLFLVYMTIFLRYHVKFVFRYLPSYTCFLPAEESHKIANGRPLDYTKKKTVSRWQNVLLSQLSYLAIFVILICITERRQLQEDPLNFNVLNIVIEVIRYESRSSPSNFKF